MKYIKFALFMLVAFCAFGLFASDDTTEALDQVGGAVGTVLSGVLKIMLIVGGFGLVGFAFFAILGKMQWKWFAGLAIAMAVLAAASFILTAMRDVGSSMDPNNSGDDEPVFSTHSN